MIFVLAVLTRFWDLGSRAMNHDESLHTYFSWLLYDEYRYTHDPLMHGPALFHLNALSYFLFGDNDVTARIVPAFFGTMIVLMPALLRSPRLLGRWGALIASSVLLFSPSILYYSRFIRHDVYTLFATFAIVIAALRYLERPERRWIIIAAVSTAFLFTTKEVSFIVAFIVVTFLAVDRQLADSPGDVWRAGRRGCGLAGDDRRAPRARRRATTGHTLGRPFPTKRQRVRQLISRSIPMSWRGLVCSA